MAKRAAGITNHAMVNLSLAAWGFSHFIVDELAVSGISGCGYTICQEMKIFGTTNHAQRTGTLNNS